MPEATEPTGFPDPDPAKLANLLAFKFETGSPGVKPENYLVDHLSTLSLDACGIDNLRPPILDDH